MKRVKMGNFECCHCPLFNEEKRDNIVPVLHSLMAEHGPMKMCEKCGTAIDLTYYDAHVKYDCDNKRTGEFLKTVKQMQRDIEFGKRLGQTSRIEGVLKKYEDMDMAALHKNVPVSGVKVVNMPIGSSLPGLGPS